MRKKIIATIIATGVIITSIYFFQNSKPLSREKIISLVENLPEVREFKKTVENSSNKGKFLIQIAGSPNEESKNYLIQVAEILDNHTATFGWYQFDPTTKIVKKEDL